MIIKERLSTKNNSRIKKLRKLKEKKYRKEFNLFTVENQKIILDALAMSYRPQAIYLTEGFLAKNPDFSDKFTDPNDTEIFYLSEDLVKHCSGLDTPAGIIATYAITEKPLDENMPSLYLDSLNDPGNLGTIIRTAIAFGFHNLVLSENCADPYNQKAISAAKNAIFQVRLWHDQDLDYLKKIKNRKKIITSVVSQGEVIGKKITENDFCLVLGSESHGVRPEIIALSDQLVRIPIADKMESLNVAMAAAILLYLYRH